jgi:hypothetical protein
MSASSGVAENKDSAAGEGWEMLGKFLNCSVLQFLHIK